MEGADGKSTGSFGLVKVALNHADMQNDVTQGYIMCKPRLKMLRSIYLAQERRVFSAAGLDHLLPKQENAEMDLSVLLAAIKAKATDPQAVEALRNALGI